MKVATKKMVLTALGQMKEEKLTLWQLLLEAQTVPLALRSTKEGDIKDGLIPVGQITGRITDIPTCRELIDRIIKEAEDTIGHMQQYVKAEDLRNSMAGHL
ncbi:MAG: hypothetical protein A2Z02_02155 [Chloroflexi bacterium RBG_16_48_7]|nr:MAG: hypothetical protein A2Z02_02155 [Chloroflexi bacterium RBG_16_48_7]